MSARPGVLALVLVCAGVPGALACTNEEPMSLEEAFKAVTYAATLNHVESMLASSLQFVALGAGSDGDGGAAMEENLRRHASCVSISRVDRVLDIWWNGCLQDGQRLTGHQIVTVTRAEPGFVEAQSEWYGFWDSHVSVAGRGSVRWTPKAGLALTYDLSWSTPSFSATSKGDQTLQFAESDSIPSVTVSGSDVADTTVGHFEIVASGMHLRADAPIADAGSLALTGPSGRHSTLRLTALGGAFVRLDFDGLEHPFALILSPKTEQPFDR